MKLIWQARAKTDPIDARKLAERPRTAAWARASNRWLKWILVEIVVTLKLAPGPVGTYYRHLLRAKGKPKAQTAAARKLCCYRYWMLKEGWTYDEWLQQHVNSQRSEVRPVQRMGAVA